MALGQERSKGIVGIFILIVVFFFIFIGFSVFTISNLKKSSSGISSGFMSDDSSSPIGVISIEKEIMESRKIIEMLHSAEKNKQIKAIILRIDSPGGAVAPTQEIYEEVRRIDEKVKPVYASFGSVAASGGYYIGAACRKIWANSGTLTGSIGVIMQTTDLSGIFEWAKFKQETIKAGKYKDIGSPSRPMTDEERLFLTKLIEGTHQQFMNDILVTRKDRLKKDINELAQGQIFHGAEAKEFGLVDEIGSLWLAGRTIFKDLKLKGDFSLRFMKPKKKRFSVQDLLQEAEDVLSFIKAKWKMDSSARPLFKFQI